MSELTIHLQIPNPTICPEFLNRLETIAEEYGVSIDDQTRQIIEETAQKRQHCVEEFLRKADAIAEEIGSVSSDSADDIRILRDSR